MAENQETIQRRRRLTYWLGFGYLLVIPTVGAFWLSAAHIGVLAAAGALAVVLVRLEDIASVRILGMEAKLRHKLDEAEEVLDQLRALAVAVSEPALATMASEGHLTAGLTLHYKYEMRTTINETLGRIGLSPERIRELNGAFDQALRSHLIGRALSGISGSDQTMRQELARLRSIPPPTADVVASFLDDHDQSSPDRRRWLRELESFEATGELADPNVLPGSETDDAS